MSQKTTFLKSLGAASATSIAASQAVTNGTPLTLTTASGVTIDTATSTNTALGRRVLLTSTSGSETASITLTGTNSSGNIITESITFATALTAQSNLDYVTITKILPTSGAVGSISAGTNGVGSSNWYTWNYRVTPPMNLAVAVELVSGAVNYTVQYTFDNPNATSGEYGITYPIPFNLATMIAQTATLDSTISTPIYATRVLINSGTGVIRCRFIQAGIG